MGYSLEPKLFFIIEEGKVLAWDYNKHKQYYLESEFFEKLVSFKHSGLLSNDTVIKDLYEGGLIVGGESEKDSSEIWGWDLLSHIFHFGTKDVPVKALSEDPAHFSRNYIQECESLKKNIPSFFQIKEGINIDLPQPDLTVYTKSLTTVLTKRITCREFYSKSIELADLSNLLYASFGVLDDQWASIKGSDYQIAAIRKSSPSSGGLHAEEAYIVVYRVNGLKEGLYYYRPQDHKLTLIEEGDFEDEVIINNYSQYYSKGMAFGVYITARLDKYWWKYPHSRAYRIMMLDMGHVSQTFLLCATALGLSTWMTGAFHDSACEEFLKVDGNVEPVILFLGVGHGSNNPLPHNMR